MAKNRDDVLRKVQALLAKADSTTFSEERDTYITKADQMMTAYAIEQFEIDQAKPADQREKPIVHDIPWDLSGDSDHINALYRIFTRLARHVHVQMGSYGLRNVKVVGYEADVRYLEMLYTSVHLHLSKEISPRSDPALTLEENIVNLKESGLKWEEMHRQLKFTEHMDDEPFSKNVGLRMYKIYKDYCKRVGQEQHKTDPKVYTRNFIWGYEARITERLREMMNERGSGTEIVLARRDGDIMETLYENFPYLKPHERDCTCASCKSSRKPVRRSQVRDYRYDPAAANRGRSAANTADLSGGRNNLGSQKRLPE